MSIFALFLFLAAVSLCNGALLSPQRRHLWSAAAGTVPSDTFCASGRICISLGNYLCAVNNYSSAINSHPSLSLAWSGLATSLALDGKKKEAMIMATVAMRLDPTSPSVVELKRELQQGHVPESSPLDWRTSDSEGIVDPEARERHKRYMISLYGRYFELEAGASRLSQGLRVVGSEPKAMISLASVLLDLLRHKDAYLVSVEAISLMTKNKRKVDAETAQAACVAAEAVHSGVLFDDWERAFLMLEEATEAQLAAKQVSCVKPIKGVLYPLDPILFLKMLSAASDDVEKKLVHPIFHHVNLPVIVRRRPLHIAYISSHFTSSSIGRELLYVFAIHNRQRHNKNNNNNNDSTNIILSCFDLSSDQDASVIGMAWKSAIRDECLKGGSGALGEGGEFVDLSSFSDYDASVEVNRRNVDIVLDANGWSGGARPAILAHHPSPLIINYKNFVASPGMRWIDYTAADRITSPPDLIPSLYRESLVLLPNCYFLSGHWFQYDLPAPLHSVGEMAHFRKEKSNHKALTAMKNEMIFSNFNNLDKLDPETLNAWVDVLSANRRWKLWIQQFPPAKIGRVLEEMEKRGIDRSRIITTPFAVSDEHIVQKSLSDLFLDNPPYNAQSTAMDCVWGGLPLLVRAGQKMGERVGASILAELGMDVLIVRNREEYVRMAIQLGSRRDLLFEIRQNLRQNVLSSSLFQVRWGVENLEAALRLTWEAKLLQNSDNDRIYHIVGADQAGRFEQDEKLNVYLRGLRVQTTNAEKVFNQLKKVL